MDPREWTRRLACLVLFLAALQAVPALAETHVFALSGDGTMRKLDDANCAPADCEWVDIDRNPRSISLAATSHALFQLHDSGSIWIWNGGPCEGRSCPHWTRIDNNRATAAIAANDRDLFQLHESGSIWRWLGGACEDNRCPSWERIDGNPRTVAIAAAGGILYQRHDNGSIWYWTNTRCGDRRCPWKKLDNNSATKAIAAAAPGNLYQLHDNGRIWRWGGRPCDGDRCPSWSMLDNNSATLSLLAAPGALYQLHRNGAIWQWLGRACESNRCPHWQKLDNNPRTRAIAAGPRRHPDDFSPPLTEPPPLYQVHVDGAVWRWNGQPCAGNRCPHWTRISRDDAFTDYDPERGGLYAFNGAEHYVGLSPLPPPLFGFVDLHTHPASFLAFGGDETGRRGMMWGRPAVGDSYRGLNFRERFDICPAQTHSGDGDPVRQMLREMIIGSVDGRTRMPHTGHGASTWSTWPSSMVLSHQQMDVEWLRRAHAGGLRLIVAATVDNEVVDTAYDWGLGDVHELLRTGFDGGDVRAALDMPRPGFAMESATRQIAFIKEMVAENDGWMEVALSGAKARDIVQRGKLAVVLGLEMDNLTPAEVDLLIAKGVRFVTPIHFVDNQFGGAAAYETMFSLLNGVIGAPADGGVPQPYSLIDDPNVSYFQRPMLEPAQDDFNELTDLFLGWNPLGELCPQDAVVAGDPARPGCVGKRNSRGLADGGAPIRHLISQGVMVDLAHMSQRSQTQALQIAEGMDCPVMNSHTGARNDTYDPALPGGGLGTERAMRLSDARRLLNLGGVIGVGTGIGELDHPRRIYYNAGNPLIEFGELRRRWDLDLRQPETQQDFQDGRFRDYRVTIRLGANDDVDPGNELRARLLGPSFETGDGWTDTCVLNPGRRALSVGEVSVTCTVSGSRPRRMSEVDGLRLDHDGTCEKTGCTGDNISIVEVRLEARAVDGPGWMTLLQRTGGIESEVVLLKGRGPVDVCRSADGSVVARDMGSHFWETRLLPKADELAGMTGLQVQTFVNQDDLGRSAPAVIDVGLSGHRDPMREEFAHAGIGSGVCAVEPVTFESGGEQADGIVSLRLSTGPESTSEILEFVAELRQSSLDGKFSWSDTEKLVAAIAPAVVASSVAATAPVVGAALMDPVTTALVGLGIFAIVELVDGSYDNWSSQVSIRAQTPSGLKPLLVNYSPVQRLKRDQPDSVLFRGLPEGIEADRLYAGVVVNFSTVNDIADGRSLEMEIAFDTDGDGDEDLAITKPAVASYDIAPGTAAEPAIPIRAGVETRAFIAFDVRRPGRSLRRFSLLAAGRAEVKIRNLDIGLMIDPVESWTNAFAKFGGLGDFSTQIGMGTDLSGFEPLIPFTAVTLPQPMDTPSDGVTHDVPDLDLPMPPPQHVPYEFDIENAAGRPDPARTRMGLPRKLDVAFIGMRPLSIHQTGISTVGQLPDFAYAASLVDPQLGRDLFSSVDGFVRAWERLDTVDGSGARARCR